LTNEIIGDFFDTSLSVDRNFEPPIGYGMIFREIIEGTVFECSICAILFNSLLTVSINTFFLHRQVRGDYQRLAYIINDYQGVHFERLFFYPYKRWLSFIGLFQLIFVPHLLLAC
jgi:hypothetical protein